MTDTSALLAANAAFYAALANGDVAGMTRLWADDDAISCIHPGWPAIVGRAAVVGSWREILRNASQPRITCRDPHAILSGDSGHVVCVELVGGVPLAASNHFRRVDGEWRLVHHQASPIAQAATPEPPPSRRVH